MTVIIDRALPDDRKDYAEECDIPCCPKCGAKAFIHHDIVDGFYFGWSVGCPKYCHYDGIHGTDENTPEKDTYTIFHLGSKEECISEWHKRVEHLKEKNDEEPRKI